MKERNFKKDTSIINLMIFQFYRVISCPGGNSTIPRGKKSLELNRQLVIPSYSNITFDSFNLILCSSNITFDCSFVTFSGSFIIIYFFIFVGSIITLCSSNITFDSIFVTFDGYLIFFSYLTVLFSHCVVPTLYVTVLLSHLVVSLSFSYI